MSFRVMLWMQIKPGVESDFERVWRKVGDSVTNHPVGSMAAFLEWERSPGHKDQTEPLRKYRDYTRPRPFEIYEVAACYGVTAGA
jgi:heme-degrading monooxygenase HmoA